MRQERYVSKRTGYPVELILEYLEVKKQLLAEDDFDMETVCSELGIAVSMGIRIEKAMNSYTRHTAGWHVIRKIVCGVRGRPG